MRLRRIAVVAPGLEHDGGIPVCTAFFSAAVRDHSDLEIEIISLATSARDRFSVRLLAPLSWVRGPRRGTVRWRGGEACQVGAWGAELEFQRYRPRRALDELLGAFDLVHVVAGFPAWGLVATRVRKPLVVHCASLAQLERATAVSGARGGSGLWRSWMTRTTERLDRAAIRAADRVLVMNPHVQTIAEGLVPPDRIALLPPGVDLTKFSPPDRRADRHVLSIARWTDPRKNVRLLLRAYAELVRRLPEAPPLVLAGAEMPARSDLELAQSLGLGSRLELRGPVPEAELVRLYRDAALFVLSSDEEGFGQVLTEAMACGTPVVSTDSGGPSTSVRVGRTGLLTPVGDAEGLARAMESLLTDAPRRHEMGAAGRREMEACFSPASIGGRLLQQYDLAVDAFNAGPRRTR